MIFWGLAAILALLTALAFVWPVLKGSTETLDRADSAIAIFRDQLAEVDRDAERGLISDQEAAAARTEIQRRMLAADRARSGKDARKGGAGLLLLFAALTPVAGAALYTQLGAPGIASQPFAERQAERDEKQNLGALTAQLRTRLLDDPGGGETRGWELLASTYMNMGRFSDAVQAFARIVERDDATSATWSQYAEALISAENGIVTKPAEDATARALELDPDNPAGTYYRAVALDQAGQTLDARKLLLDRVARAETPQPWMPAFLQEANRMGANFALQPVTLGDFFEAPRGPSAEDVEAAQEMSPEEQQAFIRTMVDNLADRLEDEPGNLQGWLQLARAYMVLGERDNARGALESAKKLTDALPENDARRETVEQGLRELGG
ncbi:cytochrome c-type biogenesis protein CcmH [Litoreibacter ponti]|uniref:Cytochrome c-type biogenesis protein CcmH n=1 Tax=Litoreibacter ponti TaxID=1510457 RepID=A0A2T6BHK9_9RHOB|nr:c-type cytochrome biogenesis protein CcmI [Litoreibacter ponti]PTX55539.1 cytochrome c-type biogenesis protein CcmH [Litoreibacter ponti]